MGQVLPEKFQRSHDVIFYLQSISKTGGIKSNNPSISITPVPGARNVAASPGLKPGAPSTGGGKDNFVICEICDGYIRDLEQLRNHMQFIHKVKIHPKMIYNRPPLNCQKCQFRFFTDQVRTVFWINRIRLEHALALFHVFTCSVK